MSLSKAEQAALHTLRQHVKKNRIGHTTHFGKRDPNGSPEGVVDNPNDLIELHGSTMILVKDIADKLTKRWPGFRWAIQPNEAGGVFNVFCLDFHDTWGYVIRYDDIMNDPKRTQALKAGREILQRFRWHGDKYDPVQMASLPRNAKGQCYPDVQGLKASRFTRQEKLRYALATGKAKVILQGDGGQIIEMKE